MPVAPNAALLIDFDNVTMGIRSDLTRQLKDLLNSDIIKGKVAVQRAYADWRRYAQYIVPLSEASVDLIFAPAYGSSKKNATDIRLAIDALELVFTRPEIGTFILLSGDSDFSSLVLKLKEYGKYVIGVGLRESASDLLVQNCDEYYSYSALTGLTRAGEEDLITGTDPWELAERAVTRMAADNDVMRSDRLKQVMLEMDPNFDESQIGYSKFNKFLVEAASKRRLAVRKLENGQYEVQPYENGDAEPKEEPRRGRGRREPRRPEPRPAGPRAAEARTVESRTAARAAAPAGPPAAERTPPRESRRREAPPSPSPSTRERRVEEMQHGYELLRRAVDALVNGTDGAARDSDIKRQMLELEPGWDESELGFTKFSRFLRQAHDAEVIDLQKAEEGYYEARMPRGSAGVRDAALAPRDRDGARGRDRDRDRDRGRGRGRGRAPEATPVTPDAGAHEEPVAEPEAETFQPAHDEAQPEAFTAAAPEPERGDEPEARPVPVPEAEVEDEAEPVAPPVGAPALAASSGAAAGARASRSLGRGRRGRPGGGDGAPTLLPGQVVGVSRGGAGVSEGGGSAAPSASPSAAEAPVVDTPVEDTPEAPSAARAAPSPGGEDFDAETLGLPTESGAVIRYLSNSYQGVGQKTAETLIEAFGADRVFNGLHAEPDRVREILGSGRRTDGLLEAWAKDYRRRTAATAEASGQESGAASA